MAQTNSLSFERSARQDLRFWAMLLVGLVFLWAGSIVDPARNCDESGDCAPWLVPVAFWMGALLACSAGATLLANPRRGSRIDPQSGELVWWQRRLGCWRGGEGRIHPDDIALVRIVSGSNSDKVHLYDRAGALALFFDEEVVSWPYEKWAERLAARWPHIKVERVSA